MSNGKDSGQALLEVIGAIVIGILGGIALASLLEHLFGEKCPVCKKPIRHGTKQCPYCHTVLGWE